MVRLLPLIFIFPGLYAEAMPAIDGVQALVSGQVSRSEERWRLYYASRPAAGTLFMIRCYVKRDAEDVAQRVRRAFDEMKRWEMILSERDARSELSRLNEAPWGQPVAVSPELESALRLALAMARETDGRFDPTLGPLVRLWRRAARTGKAPDVEEINKAREASGWRKLDVSPGIVVKTVPGMHLDLGGIGKGIMIDKMADCLRAQGIVRFLLSDTSDLLAGEAPPGRAGWSCRIGEEKILLRGDALSTSGGDYAHACIDGEESAHIIDPETGRGRSPAPAVAVRARTAAEADAKATAAFGRQKMPKKTKKDLHPAGKSIECPRSRDTAVRKEQTRM